MRRRLKNLVNSLSPNLSRAIRNAKIRKLLKATPQVSSDGVRYWGMQNYEDYEPHIYKVLASLMSRADIFVNVGANHGLYCIKLAALARKIYAFEALPDNLLCIYRNIRQNSLEEKVLVFPVAAGSGQSLERFYGAASGGSLLRGWNQQVDAGIDIPVYSLDFLLLSSLRDTAPLFLIDVEGAEFEVIKGASSIMAEVAKAVFCVEIPCREFMPGESFNPHFLDIFRCFDARGYRAYEIASDGTLLSLDMDRVQGYRTSERYEGLMAVFSRSPLSLDCLPPGN